MERVIDRGDAYRTERGQKDAVCPRNRAFEDRPEYRQSHRPAQEQHAEGEKRARPHPSYEAEQKHACGGVSLTMASSCYIAGVAFRFDQADRRRNLPATPTRSLPACRRRCDGLLLTP